MSTIESPPTPRRSVHVLPGRKGSRSVRIEEDTESFSVHPSTTEAERAAQELARRRGAREVIVHDRYCRLHTRLVEGLRKED